MPEDLSTPPRPPKGGPKATGGFYVPARPLAAISLVLAVASLTAIAVVASVSAADGLSTIALVLAIVAFVIQILVFAVQTQRSAEQSIRSEQLNAETRELLAEVKTTAQGAQAMIGQQFAQLLNAFVSGATQTAEANKLDPASFAERLLENVRAAVPTGGGSGSSAEPSAPAPPPRLSEDQRARANAARETAMRRRRERFEQAAPFRTFPSEEEGLPIAERLRQLSLPLRARLQALGEDAYESITNNTYSGLRPSPLDDELMKQGLVRHARVNISDEGTRLVTQLSDEGKHVVRPLTALGEIPRWAEDVLPDRQASSPADDDDIPF